MFKLFLLLWVTNAWLWYCSWRKLTYYLKRWLWPKAAISCPTQYEVAKSPVKVTKVAKIWESSLNWSYSTLWALPNLCLTFVDIPPDHRAFLLTNSTELWPWFSCISNLQLEYLFSFFFFFFWPSTTQANHLVSWHLLFDLKTPLPLPNNTHKQLCWTQLSVYIITHSPQVLPKKVDVGH